MTYEPTKQPQTYDVLVIGGGPVGLASAIGFARRGQTVGLVAPLLAPPDDGRTVAIMQGGLPVLERLGIWDRLRHLASPLVKLRIIDDTDNLFRAPPATFSASEIGFDCFGQNITIPDLVRACEDEAAATPRITRFATNAAKFEIRDDGVRVTLATGDTLEAPLLVGADGARSPSRDFAGIKATVWDYPQTAITALFSHERDHQDISTEFHTREGPFTLVPLSGFRSSLVWMMKPDRAERLISRDAIEFTRIVERQCHVMLGRMTLASERGSVAMRGMKVETASRHRVALVGEAAHVFPPIGAQGLNLGLRDVQSLLDMTERENTIEAALRAYAPDRARDIGARTQGVDLLNRSLISGFLPADFARGFGFMALQSISPLRKLAMRAGMGLPFTFPRLPTPNRQ